jgi:hypothetical protein
MCSEVSATLSLLAVVLSSRRRRWVHSLMNQNLFQIQISSLSQRSRNSAPRPVGCNKQCVSFNAPPHLMRLLFLRSRLRSSDRAPTILSDEPFFSRAWRSPIPTWSCYGSATCLARRLPIPLPSELSARLGNSMMISFAVRTG